MKVRRPGAFRFGALDVLIILAVVLAVSFPVVKYFTGHISRASDEPVYITLQVSGINPAVISTDARVFMRDNGREIGRITTINDIGAGGMAADVTFTLLADNVSVTDSGMYLLFRDIHIGPGYTTHVMIAGSTYSATMIRVD